MSVLRFTGITLIANNMSGLWAALLDDESMHEILPETENTSFSRSRIKKRGKLVQFGVGILGAISVQSENRSTWRRMLDERRKWIEFAVGMVGTILFQNFFRLTSFDHVLAFLYLAVSWLGNLALLRASGDFGLFNFLLGNLIVDCTVSQFGLRGTTWIAYGASILLYGLRLKLESMSYVERGARAIEAWLFSSFWAIISLTFLILGFDALDRTDLSTSISPIVMFIFKHALAIAFFD
ncbi:hypothetical protein DH2020_028744 [Rehmannia glutinosa]|uniref:Uncharacterized protein n=1 Tax=Rehmannia glutinosa TaxID=99300 RepID=A0ABR0VT78_REHGL